MNKNHKMSCLFNSLCKFVSDTSGEIRSKICDYLSSNPKINDVLASDFIMWETGQNLNDYVMRMRSTSSWGGAIEISAFTHLYNMDVHVMNIRDYRLPVNNSGITMIKFIEFKCPQITGINSNRFAKISWNGYHYEPL